MAFQTQHPRLEINLDGGLPKAQMPSRSTRHKPSIRTVTGLVTTQAACKPMHAQRMLERPTSTDLDVRMVTVTEHRMQTMPS